MGLREQQARAREIAQIQDDSKNHANPKGGAKKALSASMSAVLIALHQDIEKIRAFSSLAERANFKREYFLPKWLPFAEQYLAEGKLEQNDVVGYCLVYLFDAEDLEKAFEFADRVIASGQSLPDKFASTPAQFCANAIYNWAEFLTAKGQGVEPYFSQAFERVMTGKWKINEVLTALYFKLAALRLLTVDGVAHPAKVDDLSRLFLAIRCLRHAFYFNHKSGVKTLISRCYMRVNAIKDFLKQNGITVDSTEPPQEEALAFEVSDFDFVELKKQLSCPPSSLAELLEKMEMNHV